MNNIDLLQNKDDDCDHLTLNHMLNKTLMSISNFNYEKVDFESINIDKTYNGNASQRDWNNLKDTTTKSYSREISSIDSLHSNSLALIHHSRIQVDNRYFFIADILNKEKYYHNEERYDNPCVTIDNDFAINNTFINNSYFLKHESDYSLHVNKHDSDLISAVNESQSDSSDIAKNKTILPSAECVSNTKSPSLKRGKSSEQPCLVCNDIALGKHYGVISCEGCKGFFKRTIRKDMTYKCRDLNTCSVDRKFRNRCQSCRYNKCIAAGMKRDAVRNEKPKKRSKKPKLDIIDVETCSPPISTLTNDSQTLGYESIISQITNDMMIFLELKYNPEVEEKETFEGNAMEVISEAINDHLFSIVSWAKYVPGFEALSVDDQTLLLKMCWGELIIANFTHRSMKLNSDILLLRNGSKLLPEIAKLSGIGELTDKIIYEILHQFKNLKIDRCELCYIKSIILFNPNLKDLDNRPFIQMMRRRFFFSLRRYCIDRYPKQKQRFNKLLLRLPSLRSNAYVTLDHFRLYDIVKKATSGDRDDDDNCESARVFDFFNEMLQHTDLILDH